jgi:hypothetical protein
MLSEMQKSVTNLMPLVEVSNRIAQGREEARQTDTACKETTLPEADRLAIVLREERGEEDVRRLGQVDTSEATLHPVALVEASLPSSLRTDEARAGPGGSLEKRLQWPRPLVECWQKPHESGGVKRLAG